MVGIAVIAFSQLAMAAHACGSTAKAAQPVQASASMACDEDAPSAPLCAKHCNDEPQTPSDAYPVATPPFVPPYWMAIALTRSRDLPAISPALLHAPPLALSIRNCCFRI